MTNIRTIPAWAVALAGLLSLATAMGIGRFAFTPVLPLMMREGLIDVAGGGWLAAVNYAGYLAGALTVSRVPVSAGRLAVSALIATAVLTAGMALPGIAGWLLLRFLAGLCSSWAFVATAVWCLGALAARGRVGWGAIVYAGVGSGIACAGLYCLLAGAAGMATASIWLQLAALALLMLIPVAWVVARLAPVAAAGPVTGREQASAADRSTAGLVICYGLMGFGYILPATFLPAMARSLVDDPRLFGLAWPVFGLTAAVSTLVAGWAMRRASRLQVWAVSQLLMGAGVLLPGLWLSGWTIAASALLVGGTFMVITLAGVQEIRVRAGADATRWVGRLTAAFAAGQIAGPVASALLVALPGLRERGLGLALEIAAASLVASGVWLWRQSQAQHSMKEIADVSPSSD